ncbi:MAG: T9SS type A sorting domain-containing protein [Bacteroidota bacterium]
MEKLFLIQRSICRHSGAVKNIHIAGLFLIFNLTSFVIDCASAQNPLVKMWDSRFGGDSSDYLTCFQQTTDRGYILGGWSNSGVSGDKTQAVWGGYDYWIVKIDSLGNKQWDKNFGGDGDEELFCLQQTADGGYILGGLSTSGISGDKTQPNRDTANYYSDYWIVKIDSLGNKQWDKDFGTSSVEYLYSLQQTADGGYILGGTAGSQINGDKTQAGWGNLEYWIVKTDSLGNKEWDKDFGGTDYDQFSSLQQTADGGYILGGFSASGIGGNKTQSNWGDWDYWIVKIDSLGIIQWDKDFGGAQNDWLSSLQQTSDGGFILGGHSISGIGGDKTQGTWGGFDYWIVKVDSLGNKQWDKDTGGSGHEDPFGNVSQTSTGGYLLAGNSGSYISGDKTENNLGLEQSWIVKTDSLGNKIWDKTIFLLGHSEMGLATQTRDGCYAIVNCDNGAIGGYRTQPSHGLQDYWIVKFCEILRAYFTSPQYICPNTCTDFVNLSFNATSYQWSFPGATPDTSTATNPTNICYYNPGNYDVQLIATDSNGSDTLLLSNFITVYPAPVPQAITQIDDTLYANAGAFTIQWYFNSTLISGATNYYYVAQASGDYSVVCTDANGCAVGESIFNVIAGLESMADSRQIIVFPNPVGDKVRIQIPIAIGIEVKSGTSVEISIYNVVGEKVWNGLQEPKTTNLEVEINVSQLVQGIYFLELSPGDKTFRAKFVRQ